MILTGLLDYVIIIILVICDSIKIIVFILKEDLGLNRLVLHHLHSIA